MPVHPRTRFCVRQRLLACDRWFATCKPLTISSFCCLDSITPAKHFDGADAAVIKQVHAAVLDFVLESAKTDLEPEDVASNLEEANVSDKVASKLVDGFREHKVGTLSFVFSANVASASCQ